MGAASYLQDTFRGGEVSKSVQGQFTNKNYRSWMNRCRNALPLEQEAWTRRPGTMFCRTTRGGNAGRVIPFDFRQSSPYSMEFTDGFLRFRQGPRLVTTNDDKTVSSISAANPAVVTTSVAHGWSTGNQVFFTISGAPRLQARLCTITSTGASTFSLTDALTGATIDGSALGGAFVSGTVSRVLELATPYTGGHWADLRVVRSEVANSLGVPVSGAVLLDTNFPPYTLQVTSQPQPGSFATFSLAPSTMKDGPYLDPVKGGATIAGNALSGVVTFTITFPAYDATKAYALGDFAASGGVNYQSILEPNVGNAPPNATYWQVVSTGVVVGPNGFQGSDVGRMMRFYSEPPIWDAATAFTTGQHVSYPNGVNGGYTYWKALAASTGVQPGTDTTKWALDPAGAIWTWGKITSLVNLIDPFLAGSVNIGSLTQLGGIAAAFDGNTNQPIAACAAFDAGLNGDTNQKHVGKNYSGASAQRVASVTVWSPNNQNLAIGQIFSNVSGNYQNVTPNVTINLRAKATAPASPSDGTLLGTSGVFAASNLPVSVPSNDTTTTWNYVWVEIISQIPGMPSGLGFTNQNLIGVAEVQFFSPVAAGGSNAVKVQILGGSMLTNSAPTPYTVRVWRLGLYSNTTGWPTCGTYHEGRLWLSGAVPNRIDSSKSNDVTNFAPTYPDGSVAGDNGISYIFNSPDANPIFWMEPDQLGIVCGTQGGEWLVQATSNNVPLTPTTIQAHRYTKYNCANILPARTNLTLAVVQAFRRELLEYYADVISGRFSASDLALLAKHLVKSKIAEICYQQELIPVIWARCDDGSLAGCTYGRRSLNSALEPDVYAWHGHTLGSGRVVESICAAANEDGTLDALMMVTNDTVTNIRHVEMLTDVFLETDSPADAWFLDSAVRPTSNSALAISGSAPLGGKVFNGLAHLEGKTVQLFVAGLDCGQQYGPTGLPIIQDFVVTNGAISVPYGDGISGGTGGGLFTQALADAAFTAGQVVVGLTYTSDGQIVRPNAPLESGARSGPAFGKLRRNQQYAVLTDQTAGLSIGTTFDKLDPVLFNTEGGPPLEIKQTFSGVYRAPLTDDDTFDGMICWRVTRPLPATIAAIGGFIHTQDI